MNKTEQVRIKYEYVNRVELTGEWHWNEDVEKERVRKAKSGNRYVSATLKQGRKYFHTVYFEDKKNPETFYELVILPKGSVLRASGELSGFAPGGQDGGVSFIVRSFEILEKGTGPNVMGTMKNSRILQNETEDYLFRLERKENKENKEKEKIRNAEVKEVKNPVPDLFELEKTKEEIDRIRKTVVPDKEQEKRKEDVLKMIEELRRPKLPEERDDERKRMRPEMDRMRPEMERMRPDREDESDIGGKKLKELWQPKPEKPEKPTRERRLRKKRRF